MFKIYIFYKSVSVCQQKVFYCYTCISHIIIEQNIHIRTQKNYRKKYNLSLFMFGEKKNTQKTEKKTKK